MELYKTFESAIRSTEIMDGGKVLLYDIGGGAAGMEHAVSSIRRLAGLCPEKAQHFVLHVASPVLSNEDIGRRHRISNIAEQLRFVHPGGTPGALDAPTLNDGLVQVCEHTLGTCSCFMGYQTVVAISVHSLYYLEEWELLRFSKELGGAATITAAIHRPSEGGMLPVDTPEFAWVGARDCEVFGWHERLLSWVRGKTLGDPYVAMVPLSHAGTVYVHPQCTWLRFGGKHLSAVTSFLDHWTREWSALFLLMVVALLSAVAFISLLAAGWDCVIFLWDTIWWCQQYNDLQRHYGWISDVPLVGGVWYRLLLWWFLRPPRLTTPAVLAVVFEALGVVATFFSARALAYSSREPGFLTTATLSFIHRTSLGQREGDPIVDVIELYVGPPRPLSNFTFGNVSVQPEMLRQAMAILLSADGVERSGERVTASLLRRFGYSTSRTLATVQLANRRVAAMRATLSGDQMESGARAPHPVGNSLPLQSALARLNRATWRQAVVFSMTLLALRYVFVTWFLRAVAPGWWA